MKDEYLRKKMVQDREREKNDSKKLFILNL